MRTILNDMANFYFDFFNNGEFDPEYAKKALVNLGNMDKRIDYIREIYENILNSDCINEVSKIFIKSRKSYFDIAKYYNNIFRDEIENYNKAVNEGKKAEVIRKEKDEPKVKADINYTNKKLNNTMRFIGESGEVNDIFFVLTRTEISDSDWKIIKESLEKLKVMCNGNLINKDNFWLNVPVKGFNKELSEEEFNNLFNLIKPYFASEKSIAQLKLNKMKKEVGYLNYILKENIDLDGIDKSRRDMILRFLSKDNLDDYKKENSTKGAKENPEIKKVREEVYTLEEIVNSLTKKRDNTLVEIGKFYVKARGAKTIGSVEYESQMKVLESTFAQARLTEQKYIKELKEKQEYLNSLLEQQEMIYSIKSLEDN